jgi:hypothetical protein
MGESHSIWSGTARRRPGSDREALADYLLIAAILIIMAVAQVQFTLHAAGPDSVNLIQAAEANF